MVDNKSLKELLKEYNGLTEEQKIVSLSDINNMANRIIEMTDSLKNMIGDQLSELEEDFDPDNCECDESPLYDVYCDIHDAVCEANIYKVVYLLNSCGNVTKSESCACEIEKPKVEVEKKKIKRVIKK